MRQPQWLVKSCGYASQMFRLCAPSSNLWRDSSLSWWSLSSRCNRLRDKGRPHSSQLQPPFNLIHHQLSKTTSLKWYIKRWGIGHLHRTSSHSIRLTIPPTLIHSKHRYPWNKSCKTIRPSSRGHWSSDNTSEAKLSSYMGVANSTTWSRSTDAKTTDAHAVSPI